MEGALPANSSKFAQQNSVSYERLASTRRIQEDAIPAVSSAKCCYCRVAAIPACQNPRNGRAVKMNSTQIYSKQHVVVCRGDAMAFLEIMITAAPALVSTGYMLPALQLYSTLLSPASRSRSISSHSLSSLLKVDAYPTALPYCSWNVRCQQALLQAV